MHAIKKTESRIEELEVKKRYGKRERILCEDDLVLYSIISLDADI